MVLEVLEKHNKSKMVEINITIFILKPGRHLPVPEFSFHYPQNFIIRY